MLAIAKIDIKMYFCIFILRKCNAMLDDLYIFVVVTEVGSLTKAADKLNMTAATVSRRITHLEEALGQKLLHRAPRGLTLTRDGELYYQQFSHRLIDVKDQLNEINQQQNDVSGRLRILIPSNFATGPLQEYWQIFLEQYPQIQLRVDANNAIDDFHHLKADLAIRIGKMPDSNLLQKRLGSVKTILVAKPGCWSISSLEALSNVPIVTPDVLTKWTLKRQSGEVHTLNVPPQFSTNDLAVSKSMIKSGKTIGLLPMSEVHQDIENNLLEQLLPEWNGPIRVIYLVWPNRHSLSIRAKLFIECLTNYLHKQPWFEA